MTGSRTVFTGIALLRSLKALVALFTITLSSKYFGTSLERDTWLLSMVILPLITGIFFGPISEIFRAKFIMIQTDKGEAFALRSAVSLISAISICSFVFILGLEFFSHFAASTIAPGYSEDQLGKLIIMIRIMAPSLLLQVIIQYWTGLLNCYSIFYVPEYFGIFSGILNVSMIILLAPKIGIMSLVVSYYAGSIILLLTMAIVFLKKRIPVLQFVPPRVSLIKPYIKYALPFYLNYFTAQLTQGIEKALTTNLGRGNISVLDYARKFSELPSSIVQSTIGTIVSPVLARLHAEKENIGYISEFVKIIRFLLLGTVPVFILLFICSDELVHILLFRGVFEEQFVLPTIMAIKWFSFGIIGVILFSLSNQALVAAGKGKLVAFSSMILGLLTLTANWLFYRQIGIMFFAMTWSLGLILIGLFLMYFVVERSFQIYFKKILFVLPVYFIITIATFYLREFIYYYFNIDNNLERIIVVGVIISVSITLLINSIYLLNLNEKYLLNSFVKRLIKHEKHKGAK